MATYTAMRLGELSALTRRNLDLAKATVTVVASASELANGTRIVGDPKSSPAGAPCRSPLQSFRRSLTTSSSSPNRGPTAFSSSA